MLLKIKKIIKINILDYVNKNVHETIKQPNNGFSTEWNLKNWNERNNDIKQIKKRKSF